MKSSIGQESAAERADVDQDGVADLAEKSFEETSRTEPRPEDRPPAQTRKPPRTSPGGAGLGPVLPDSGGDQRVEAPFNSN